MALAPAPAAPAAPMDAATEAPLPNAAADAALEEDAASEAVVVATILRNADGSFTLETGDEPEPEADPTMAPADGAAAAPAGQTFSADEGGIGKLMTAVLDLVDPENAGGAQSQAAFQEGFTGEKPKPPAPAA